MTDWMTTSDLLGTVNVRLEKLEAEDRARDERRRSLMQRYPNATKSDLFSLHYKDRRP